jgi:hypothetical protein
MYALDGYVDTTDFTALPPKYFTGGTMGEPILDETDDVAVGAERQLEQETRL